MLNDPTTLSPVLERLEDEDWDVCAAIKPSGGPHRPVYIRVVAPPPIATRCIAGIERALCRYTFTPNVPRVRLGK